MPQYQGIWTMQDAARLQSQQQWVTDPLFDNTILLLQADNAANAAQNNTFLDSSSNNFTVTRTGATRQGTFTPFSQSSGWWSAYIGGGASGGLQVSDNVALRPNTSDFTLEFWINFSSVSGTQTVFSKGGTSANQLLVRTNNNTGTLLVVVSGTTIITASSGSSVGVWDHYALTRVTNTWTLYRNGVSVGTTTNSTSISTTSAIGIGESTVFNSMTGYISNLRLTIGAALYTSTFTPPLTPLTTTSQGASATQVELLTCQSNRLLDNSTNNFAVSISTNSAITAFSPFAPQYQWSQSLIGGSAQFDGAGDYLSLADNTALRLGTSAFTIQAWVYRSVAGVLHGIIAKGAAATGFVLQVTAANQLQFTHTSTSVTTTTTIPAGVWTHVAAVRTSTAANGFQLYINGVSSATATVSTNFTQTNTLYVGADRVAANPMNGYISGLKFTNGTAETITVPTTPPTATTNVALLLNFTNAAIYDGTMQNAVRTANNAQVSTSVVKYGAGSMAFDGVDDYLSLPYSPLFNFDTGQFTIECWVNFTTLSGNRMIFDTYTSAALGGGYQLYWRGTGTSITFYANGVVVAQSSFTTHATGVWYHVAVTRDSSNVVRIFIDGTQYASATYATAINMATTGFPAVGIQLSTLTNDLAGYVDDLRITKGVARYTANFTPPQVALPRQ